MKTLVKASAWALVGFVVGVGGNAMAVDDHVAAGSIEFVEVQFDGEVKGAVPERASTPATRSTAAAPFIPLGQGYGGEVEPNGTSALATPLTGSNLVVRANLFPNGDVDFYSFTANAGDRVYAASMTSGSAGSSTDSQLTLLASDGTTIVEFDDDNGTFAGLSSSIAGATIPTAGTYYLKANDFTAGTTSERPYEVHFRLQSGAPTVEVEPNDTPATANPLPSDGWVSGARGTAVATEQDWYSLNLNAGDTVYLSLDLDPERDATVWNGRLGFALFGDAGNQIIVVDDAGTGDVAPNPNLPSEAMFFTVKEAGTYFAFVDSASAAVGGATATYNLSVSVHPAVDEGVNCTTYSSSNVPVTLGPATGVFTSTLTVPGNPRIADIDVSIELNHALMQDLDVQLIAPNGNSNGLFTDIGASATGGQNQMNTTFDDEAGIPPGFTVLRGIQIKPELAYRLSWFDGMDAGGTWTLQLSDDTTGANGGTLSNWSVRICELPPPPTCPSGFAETTVYSTDFEADAAGFTSSGTLNEWERGLPATLPTATANPVAGFNSCSSGTNCFKTDLDGTYDFSSTHDLLSPNINLAGLSPPVVVSWSHRYQMESASFDHYHVDFRQAGGGTSRRLFEWLDATMSNAPGNPVVQTPAAAGWAVRRVRADELAGLNTELLFHVDGDSTVSFGGVAIDDVSVTACRALSADLSITKTNGTTTSVPGTSTTYTITASNAGGDPVTGATVADTFPAALSCTWTCAGAGGGACTAAGSGNLNDLVNLPAGGSVTYTATCSIAAGATGTLSNTATITSSITDPVPGNNSATDTDTLTPQADLSITKTDGVTVVTPGGNTTYTIVASNAGPSNAPGSTVADTAPAACTSFTWTCVGAGGGTCTANGSGSINDSVNLPMGGSVSYTASCAISAGAAGSLVNTATVSTAGGVTEVNAGNNSATDTDTITAAGVVGVLSADLNFGGLTVGNNAQQILTISNSGGSPITINGLTAATAPFATIAGGSCGVTPFVLNAGQSCTVLYRFSPGAAGSFTQVITVSSNVGSVDVTLRGTGVALVRVPLDGISSMILLAMLALGSMLVLRRRG